MFGKLGVQALALLGRNFHAHFRRMAGLRQPQRCEGGQMVRHHGVLVPQIGGEPAVRPAPQSPVALFKAYAYALFAAKFGHPSGAPLAGKIDYPVIMLRTQIGK